MEGSVVITVVLATVSIGIATGDPLTCLECTAVYQPRHCHRVTQCPSGQVCGVDRVMTADGDIRYNLGCRQKEKCHSEMSLTQNQTNIFKACFQCCEQNLCNAAGCGEPGYPAGRGPMCYSCDILDDPGKCRTIMPCETDEVCTIESREEFSDILYKSGCKLQHSCHELVQTNQAGLIGRRRRQISGGHSGFSSCVKCCHDDLCNKECDSQQMTDKDGCTSSPCVHGTCIDGANDYTCVCEPGYSGKQCQIGTDDCASSPCGYGTCFDGINNYTCVCPPGYGGKHCQQKAQDCYDVLRFGSGSATGVYPVHVNVSGQLELLQVYCDMDTDGGGWTVFQKRFDGSVDFYQNFNEYENGFGNVSGEFWLGLKWVYWMTKEGGHDMRIDMMDMNAETFYASYKNFYLDPPTKYTLHISTYLGNKSVFKDIDIVGYPRLNKYSILIGPPPFRAWKYCNCHGLSDHRNQPFSTKDRDQDSYPDNCAVLKHAGYWYYSCNSSNLNGNYQESTNDHTKDFYWTCCSSPLKRSEMKFRRRI